MEEIEPVTEYNIRDAVIQEIDKILSEQHLKPEDVGLNKEKVNKIIQEVTIKATNVEDKDFIVYNIVSQAIMPFVWQKQEN